LLNGRVFDGARAIALRRTNVDHRIEFDPRVVGLLRIEVDSPQVGLSRSVIQKQGFCPSEVRRLLP
jgi:hypothetical protein